MRHLALAAFPLLLSAPLSLASSVEPVPLGDVVNESLDLVSSKLLDVTMVGDIGQPVTALLHLDGVTMQLAMAPHSVRTADYEVRVQNPDGSWTIADPGPVRTLRGTVAELPGSTVAASWSGDGLEARIRLATGEDWWIQPVDQLSGAGAAAHVLYRNQDVLSLRGCGVDQLENP